MTDRHAISPYPLRMPDVLRQALEVEAQKIGRSLHAEIISRLERSLSSGSQELSAAGASLAVIAESALTLSSGFMSADLTEQQELAAERLRAASVILLKNISAD